MTFADVFRLFFAPREVTEIRAYGLNGKARGWEGFARGAGVVAGYFDDASAFELAAAALEAAKAPGIYFVLNPVNPALLARGHNRLKAADQKTNLTTDKDVLCLRWLYLDLDPIRPAGISSTDVELAAAVAVRDKIARVLAEQWHDPEASLIKAISGNGAHLLLRLPDLPVEEKNVLLIKRLLSAAKHFLGTDQVDIDQTVYNPSRICKLYGTTARKGDSTSERPHRKSYLE
jgi:hypothetical protein